LKPRPEQKWDRTQNFSKFMHPLWDLGLIQRFLKKREDLLVFMAMLRYSDFNTGECVVFISTLMRETGIEHATQVQRIQEKIEKTGAFWRPEGKMGFKKVYGKSVKRYYRATGKQVLAHAIENGLISEEKKAEIELRQVQQGIEAEAATAGCSPDNETSSGDNGDWGDTEAIMRLPATIDDLIDEERIGAA